MAQSINPVRYNQLPIAQGVQPTDQFPMIRGGEYHRVPLIIGGVNLLPNSNDRNFVGWNGSTVVNHGKVSVPEWGATDANRVTVSGGNQNNPPADLMTMVNFGVFPVGQVITLSFWMRNNGATPITLNSNLGGRVGTLQPNEGRRVVFPGIVSNEVSAIQIQIRSANRAPVDFTWWRIQLEDGSVATDWSPSFLDFQPLITGAASTITDDNLTPNRAVFSNPNGKLAASQITSGQLLHLSGVNAPIQGQLDGLGGGITTVNNRVTTLSNDVHERIYGLDTEIADRVKTLETSWHTLSLSSIYAHGVNPLRARLNNASNVQIYGEINLIGGEIGIGGITDISENIMPFEIVTRGRFSFVVPFWQSAVASDGLVRVDVSINQLNRIHILPHPPIIGRGAVGITIGINIEIPRNYQSS